MRLPSIKTLKSITSHPRELRKLLEVNTLGELWKYLDADRPFGPRSKFSGGFESTRRWVRQCYNTPNLHDTRMDMMDTLCRTCGVEYIPRGRGAKSPAIEYLNAGDTYTDTLLYIEGRYRVGCWGDIVERGDYD
jgi:hypothetical protein